MQILDNGDTIVFEEGISAPHVHIRQDLLMADAIHFSDPYSYITAMGNTDPLIETAKDALDYREKAEKHDPKPKLIMTIMLTKNTTVKTIRDAHRAGIRAVKYIPAGTSTGATEKGVRLFELLETKSEEINEIRKLGMIFSGHYELIRSPITNKLITWWKREEKAIPYLKKLVKKFPGLKIVVEHASTRKMIEFIKDTPPNVVATLTLHHALYTKNQAFYSNGKIKDPFLLCLPSLKSEDDRLAVEQAMLSGNPKFFFGPDCAPHYESKKRGKNPPTGICTPAVVAIPLLIQIFEKAKKLPLLDLFASTYILRFYDLRKEDTRKIVAKRIPWTVCSSYNGIRTLMADKELEWQIAETALYRM